MTLLLAFCISVAIGASGYLLWAQITSSPIAGCGSGGGWVDCGHVASSRWAGWLGIPVSLLALGIYLAMAAALFAGSAGRFRQSVRRVGWAVVTAAAFAAGLSAIWFVVLQLFVLKHVCLYCMIAHACGLIATVTMLLASPLRAKAMYATAALSFAGFAILAVGQMFTRLPDAYQIETFDSPVGSELDPFEVAPPTGVSPADEGLDDGLFQAPTGDNHRPATTLAHLLSAHLPGPARVAWPTLLTLEVRAANSGESQEANQRVAAIQGGAIKLNVAQWPHSGPSDAKYVVVELFDYCCLPCRKTYAAVSCAQEKLGDQLAVVLLPVPLNAKCNPTVRVTPRNFEESCDLAKLAVAVWRLEPEHFAEFHNWMLQDAQAPSYAAAKAKAATLVEATKLDAELASGIPDQYIAKHVQIYQRVGKGTIPKLMFPRTSIVGEYSSAAGLIDLIQREGQ